MVAAEWLFAWLFVEAGDCRDLAALVSRGAARHRHARTRPGLLASLLARIESERFTSPRLTTLHADAADRRRAAIATHRAASAAGVVARLDAQPDVRAARVRPAASSAAGDRDRSMARASYGAAVAEWLRAVGEIEALAALATFAYERPDDPLSRAGRRGPGLRSRRPRPSADPPRRSPFATTCGSAATAPRVIIVSGSNMSGKSTLLRSVGVNVVLALAGAPVTAARLRLSAARRSAPRCTSRTRSRPGTRASTRRSSAFALIVDAARGAGAAAVPARRDPSRHQLARSAHRRRRRSCARWSALGAIGLVTTHDLALTELPSTLRPPPSTCTSRIASRTAR